MMDDYMQKIRKIKGLNDRYLDWDKVPLTDIELIELRDYYKIIDNSIDLLDDAFMLMKKEIRSRVKVLQGFCDARGLK